MKFSNSSIKFATTTSTAIKYLIIAKENNNIKPEVGIYKICSMKYIGEATSN